MNPLQHVSTALIVCYQYVLSPDSGILGRMFGLGPVCTMYPSCSEYTKLAVMKYGAVKGIYFGTLRVFRCHPAQKKLVDPP